ncbi:MAG: hypothetical protein GY811_09815 [Myxococcales bacterium]|nr:hypothetical protein [Myxococcales bacterium]
MLSTIGAYVQIVASFRRYPIGVVADILASTVIVVAAGKGCRAIVLRTNSTDICIKDDIIVGAGICLDASLANTWRAVFVRIRVAGNQENQYASYHHVEKRSHLSQSIHIAPYRYDELHINSPRSIQ